MQLLTQHLFQGDKQQALQQINSTYQDQGYCIVSYVYGAVIIRHNLLDNIQSSSLTPWQQALFGSDIILPDGAALRAWRRTAYKLQHIDNIDNVYQLHNLNGTDFFPYLLEQFLSQGPVNLVCYAVYDEKIGLMPGYLINKANDYLKQHYNIQRTYTQEKTYNNDDMSDRNRDAMAQACNPDIPTIMMVCTGVPKQEMRSFYHRENLKKYHIIACNQGGTLDYWAGRETRAPKVIRTLQLEALRRLFSDPAKNRSKFWISFKMCNEIIKLWPKVKS